MYFKGLALILLFFLYLLPQTTGNNSDVGPLTSHLVSSYMTKGEFLDECRKSLPKFRSDLTEIQIYFLCLKALKSSLDTINKSPVGGLLNSDSIPKDVVQHKSKDYEVDGYRKLLDDVSNIFSSDSYFDEDLLEADNSLFSNSIQAIIDADRREAERNEALRKEKEGIRAAEKRLQDEYKRKLGKEYPEAYHPIALEIFSTLSEDDIKSWIYLPIRMKLPVLNYYFLLIATKDKSLEKKDRHKLFTDAIISTIIGKTEIAIPKYMTLQDIRYEICKLGMLYGSGCKIVPLSTLLSLPMHSFKIWKSFGLTLQFELLIAIVYSIEHEMNFDGQDKEIFRYTKEKGLKLDEEHKMRKYLAYTFPEDGTPPMEHFKGTLKYLLEVATVDRSSQLDYTEDEVSKADQELSAEKKEVNLTQENDSLSENVYKGVLEKEDIKYMSGDKLLKGISEVFVNEIAKSHLESNNTGTNQNQGPPIEKNNPPTEESDNILEMAKLTENNETGHRETNEETNIITLLNAHTTRDAEITIRSEQSNGLVKMNVEGLSGLPQNEYNPYSNAGAGPSFIRTEHENVESPGFENLDSDENKPEEENTEGSSDGDKDQIDENDEDGGVEERDNKEMDDSNPEGGESPDSAEGAEDEKNADHGMEADDHANEGGGDENEDKYEAGDSGDSADEDGGDSGDGDDYDNHGDVGGGEDEDTGEDGNNGDEGDEDGDFGGEGGGDEGGDGGDFGEGEDGDGGDLGGGEDGNGGDFGGDEDGDGGDFGGGGEGGDGGDFGEDGNEADQSGDLEGGEDGDGGDFGGGEGDEGGDFGGGEGGDNGDFGSDGEGGDSGDFGGGGDGDGGDLGEGEDGDGGDFGEGDEGGDNGDFGSDGEGRDSGEFGGGRDFGGDGDSGDFGGGRDFGGDGDSGDFGGGEGGYDRFERNDGLGNRGELGSEDSGRYNEFGGSGLGYNGYGVSGTGGGHSEGYEGGNHFYGGGGTDRGSRDGLDFLGEEHRESGGRNKDGGYGGHKYYGSGDGDKEYGMGGSSLGYTSYSGLENKDKQNFGEGPGFGRVDRGRYDNDDFDSEDGFNKNGGLHELDSGFGINTVNDEFNIEWGDNYGYSKDIEKDINSSLEEMTGKENYGNDYENSSLKDLDSMAGRLDHFGTGSNGQFDDISGGNSGMNEMDQLNEIVGLPSGGQLDLDSMGVDNNEDGGFMMAGDLNSMDNNGMLDLDPTFAGGDFENGHEFGSANINRELDEVINGQGQNNGMSDKESYDELNRIQGNEKIDLNPGDTVNFLDSLISPGETGDGNIEVDLLLDNDNGGNTSGFELDNHLESLELHSNTPLVNGNTLDEISANEVNIDFDNSNGIQIFASDVDKDQNEMFGTRNGAMDDLAELEKMENDEALAAELQLELPNNSVDLEIRDVNDEFKLLDEMSDGVSHEEDEIEFLERLMKEKEYIRNNDFVSTVDSEEFTDDELDELSSNNGQISIESNDYPGESGTIIDKNKALVGDPTGSSSASEQINDILRDLKQYGGTPENLDIEQNDILNLDQQGSFESNIASNDLIKNEKFQQDMDISDDLKISDPNINLDYMENNSIYGIRDPYSFLERNNQLDLRVETGDDLDGGFKENIDSGGQDDLVSFLDSLERGGGIIENKGTYLDSGEKSIDQDMPGFNFELEGEIDKNNPGENYPEDSINLLFESEGQSYPESTYKELEILSSEQKLHIKPNEVDKILDEIIAGELELESDKPYENKDNEDEYSDISSLFMDPDGNNVKLSTQIDASDEEFGRSSTDSKELDDELYLHKLFNDQSSEGADGALLSQYAGSKGRNDVEEIDLSEVEWLNEGEYKNDLRIDETTHMIDDLSRLFGDNETNTVDSIVGEATPDELGVDPKGTQDIDSPRSDNLRLDKFVDNEVYLYRYDSENESSSAKHGKRKRRKGKKRQRKKGHKKRVRGPVEEYEISQEDLDLLYRESKEYSDHDRNKAPTSSLDDNFLDSDTLLNDENDKLKKSTVVRLGMSNQGDSKSNRKSASMRKDIEDEELKGVNRRKMLRGASPKEDERHKSENRSLGTILNKQETGSEKEWIMSFAPKLRPGRMQRRRDLFSEEEIQHAIKEAQQAQLF
ncbi:signal peptide containing protein [Cryptosporidium canis]|uniref:Signal peptide containing protein n=1 Tax=Cryptosporidium canis TaxID=195482 RepID=A0A9D5DFK6_9CRYT|nr:signal peptide containing protein [Cryptosporidium canis]